MPANSLGGTYGGNALGCAALSATVDVLTAPEFLPHVREVGAYIAQRLQRETPIVSALWRASGGLSVRQTGLFIAVDLPLQDETEAARRMETSSNQGTFDHSFVPRNWAAQFQQNSQQNSIAAESRPTAEDLRVASGWKIPVGEVLRRLREDEGVLVHTCGKNSVRIIPPLVLSIDEAALFCDAFDRVMAGIALELEVHGEVAVV